MTEAEQAKAPDFWDHAMPGMCYMHSAPTRLHDLWSEEQNTLYIREGLGGFWLESPGRVGERRFPTLAEAKEAGEALEEDEWAKLPGRMLAEAGLDASTWSFEYREGARFRCLQDERLVVEVDMREGMLRGDRFEAFDGDDSVGTYSDPGAAADALLDRPSPGL